MEPDKVYVPATVLGPGAPGYLRVVLGQRRGLLDGGVPIDVPSQAVPAGLRLPNAEFIAVLIDGTFVEGRLPE